MVVNLNISQWAARKYDAKVSKEVEASHKAHDAGRFNKILIATEALKAIQKVAGSARTYHYYNTLPWGDNGDRVLPAANYFNYVGEMGKFRNEFENLVSEFVSQYPALKDDAEIRLNTMFNEGDYPVPGAIREKFGVKFSFMPVSDADDFRVDLNDDEVLRIRCDIENQITDRVTNSIKDMINRIKEAVTHMAEKLADKESIFRDSLVGNVCSLIDVIPLLNFNDDPHVTEVVELIRPLCVSPELLRTSPEFREEIAKKASDVLGYI